MATDYSTRPLTPMGQALYGVGIGFIVVIIRKLGGYPEGVTYAILIMNVLTPYLNKLRVKKYGFVPPVKPAKPSKEASK
jgi:electron transport complex protein RnfD